MKLFAFLTYNLALLAGAAYLITQHAWSPWWMVGAMAMCFVDFKSTKAKQE